MSEGLAALRLALRSGLAQGTIRPGRFAPESNGGGGEKVLRAEPDARTATAVSM